MRTRLLCFAAMVAASMSLSSSPGFSQDGPKSKGDFPFPRSKGSSAKPGDLKKYDDVITKDFTTQPGVFALHRHDEKVYFEIPQDKFNRLFLWQAEVAKGPGGGSWGGASLGDAILKLERRGDKIYLWRMRRSPSDPMAKAIQAAVEASVHRTRSSPFITSSAKARTGLRSSTSRMSR